MGQPKAGSITVDPEIVEMIVEEVETRNIDAILGQIYELPLPEACYPIIASIVEKYVCAELMNIHFESTQMASVGGDAGYGSVMYQQANNELKQLVLGKGIFIPGVMSAEESNYMKEGHGISLTIYGAVPKSNIPDTITRNRTTIGPIASRVNNKDPFEFNSFR